VTIFGGARASGLKRLGKAKVGAGGKFAFKAKAGTFFRATAAAAPGAFPGACTLLTLPAPCVNPTVNGFAAQSKVIRKK
jgi:hypothetical protein